MKADIHPKYEEITVKCLCGNQFQSRSTKSEISTEICSQCHPFYTVSARDTTSRRLSKARGSGVCGSVRGDFVYGRNPLISFSMSPKAFEGSP